MILNPGIISLISASFLVVASAVYASIVGIQILIWWDIKSGSRRQLVLEKKTYLVATIFSYVLVFQLLSLFLFVYTADHIHSLFVGAMCAAGALNVNDFGYPTLVLKVVNFVLCGTWVIINHADNKGVDYPLIRFKYKFLIFISCLLVMEAFLQIRYFTALRADIITSCCGALFSVDAESIAGEMAALPPRITRILFFLSVILTVRVGIHFLVRGKGGGLYGVLSIWFLMFSMASIVSFISVYFYELPTHHCPFCLLQKDYHFIGYPLYLSLLAGGIFGVSVGMLNGFAGIRSLKESLPVLQKRLCVLSISCFIVFVMISLYPMVFSDFVL